ncbi:exodeoxyribonuclease VII small subunit [Nostocoides australiense]|uniref:Exodeoxyribonuclease VII small subunit n=1 Tax=Nostocoides australiense Ben110 TaxID=1193182 RepID=W6JX41_9MICO|nr:exodeoxyribonuclease VII small subunit [Tetrasphaera australiensis]MCA0291148.1 exodeoxyribonuclease VII small subunit [Actinomycetota bacterium]MCB1300157.1 exodeoxyribonuclease VII small subunit [Tetrasphaera sp.]CCH73311.1 Exodeoxyribonuclease 7 small subunit [Tetrasphaera australiensis Ben110]HPF80937.1 exodeoxyribonuclease VII small subunit [Tetrasphaera australiensis]HRW02220.1 exodeoxyribonuclease VII small subunit [Tetrasphaera sp.]
MAADQTEFPDVAEFSYEQARDELVDVVARLEGGQVGLEESMTLWRRGEALAAHCTAWLTQAEAAVAEQSQEG